MDPLDKNRVWEVVGWWIYAWGGAHPVSYRSHKHTYFKFFEYIPRMHFISKGCSSQKTNGGAKSSERDKEEKKGHEGTRRGLSGLLCRFTRHVNRHSAHRASPRGNTPLEPPRALSLPQVTQNSSFLIQIHHL